MLRTTTRAPILLTLWFCAACTLLPGEQVRPHARQMEAAVLPMARAALEAGQLETATRLYRRLLEVDPRSVEARMGLAATAIERRDPAAAARWYSTALIHTRSPGQQHAALLGHGRAALSAGQLEAARRSFARLADPGEGAPDGVAAWGHNGVGLTLLLEGDVHGAVGAMEQAVVRAPDEKRFEENLSRALAMLAELDALQPPPEPVAGLPEPVAALPEPVAAPPEPVAAPPEPVEALPEPVAALPEPVVAQPAPVEAQPEPASYEDILPGEDVPAISWLETEPEGPSQDAPAPAPPVDDPLPDAPDGEAAEPPEPAGAPLDWGEPAVEVIVMEDAPAPAPPVDDPFPDVPGGEAAEPAEPAGAPLDWGEPAVEVIVMEDAPAPAPPVDDPLPDAPDGEAAEPPEPAGAPLDWGEPAVEVIVMEDVPAPAGPESPDPGPTPAPTPPPSPDAPAEPMPGARSDAAPDPAAPTVLYEDGTFFVQVGAFASPTNAENAVRAVRLLTDHPVWASVPAPAEGQPLSRVRIGPVPSADDLVELSAALQEHGYGRLVLEDEAPLESGEPEP